MFIPGATSIPESRVSLIFVIQVIVGCDAKLKAGGQT